MTEALPIIWFFIWGLLWAIYFVLDGFDLGLGLLLPAVAKYNKNRQVVYSVLGPFWDGNEAWLIAAGGVTFAAFPGAYASIFSAFYLPFMVILFGLILRGAALGLRGEIQNQIGRTLLDGCLVIGSGVPILLFGVVFANIFRGLPLDQDGNFTGSLLSLVHPFSLAGGLLFTAFCAYHGLLWLCFRAGGRIQIYARDQLTIVFPILGALAVAVFIMGDSYANLYPQYLKHPALFGLPVLALAALALSRFYIESKSFGRALFAASAFFIFYFFSQLSGTYPALLRASGNPDSSLTIFNAAASPLTLKIMLLVVVIVLPLVILYQTWAYTLFLEKIRASDLEE